MPDKPRHRHTLPVDHDDVSQLRTSDADKPINQRRMRNDQPCTGQADRMLKNSTTIRDIQRHIDCAKIIQRKPSADRVRPIW